MDTQIVILAAGKGKRMGQADLPKVLLPLQGKPVIAHLLAEVAKLPDMPTPIIVVGYKSGLVRETLGKSYKYALQREQLGTAHAVWSAQNMITAKNVLVLLGDAPFFSAASLRKLISLHATKFPVISMFTSFVPDFRGKYQHFHNLGRIIRNKFGEIVKIQEVSDATEEQKKIREINPGIYMFRTDWLWDSIDQIDNKNAQNEFYLTDVIEVAIRENETVCSLAINPREIFGINTLTQLEQAVKLIS